jgi:predicted kinase
MVNSFKHFLLSESINDKSLLKACFMSGSPASGKSYVLQKITSGAIAPRIVNTDKITEFLGVHTTWNIHGSHVKLITQKQLTNYVNSLLPLWIDSTSTDEYVVLKRKNLLETYFGYDTAMIYVNTPLELVLKRNAERERHVDEKAIRKMYRESQLVKKDLAKTFDFYFEINNDTDLLTDEIILESYKKAEKFFLSPLENGKGKDILAQLQDKNKKYMSDLIPQEEIWKPIQRFWYAKV